MLRSEWQFLYFFLSGLRNGTSYAGNCIKFLWCSLTIGAEDNYNIIMGTIKFEWDEHKNASNRHKHGISFEEAATVFYDEEALVRDDPEHSAEEERFIILGLSNKAHLLVVCHCYRVSETVIRIISARKATKTESKYYERSGI